MSDYHPPLDELEFVLEDVAGLDRVRALPGFEEATPDLVEAILREAGRLAAEVLAPLNRTGDSERSRRLEDGSVRTPEGWKEAYRAFVDGGWNSLAFDPRYGGQGLPWVVGTAVAEMWHSANMSFALCPLLSQSAVEAVSRHAGEALKALYLPHLVSGEWAGTMNLTEPQAGSDLGAVRTRAVPKGDHWLISGQKIFITYGEHDLTDNIVHLVLARTPDAPEGAKGISLFIVPKFVPDETGAPGRRNDVRCVSLEHKLGIHASPTAVLSYGDEGGAVGYLVGEENRGLEYMFTMMNVARHAIGVEGYAIAERAYQQALAYARERIQGRPAGQHAGERVAIIVHPDVRRMLMDMRCRIEAMRALGLYTAAAMDIAARDPDDDERRRAQSRVELLTPVVKGWCTEVGNEIASLGVQVHGGMGFIEETGAAQHFRDARITTIYEGTTGIQASDLAGRKLVRDGGAMAKALIAEMSADAGTVAGDRRLADCGRRLADAIGSLGTAVDWMLDAARRDPRLPAAASYPYLMLWGTVAGGWQMVRAARAAARRLEQGTGSESFYRARITTADYYGRHVLPRAGALCATIVDGSEAVLGATDEVF